MLQANPKQSELGWAPFPVHISNPTPLDDDPLLLDVIPLLLDDDPLLLLLLDAISPLLLELAPPLPATDVRSSMPAIT
jgi:hypothetical protein